MADILVTSAGTIVNIAMKIKEAVETVDQNEDECRKIARCVERNSRVLELLAKETDITKVAVMRDALEDVKITFEEALKLIRKCQNRHIFLRFISAKDMANDLNMVLRDIGLMMQQASLCSAVHNATKIYTVAIASPPSPLPPLPPSPGEEDTEVSPAGFARFSLSELKKATNNFSEENKIGEGGSSSVYKGVLYDGREVAIKHLYQPGSEEMCVGEFIVGTKLQHKNIVSLLGYCIGTRGAFTASDDKLVLARYYDNFLVLGYLSNGSLDEIVRGIRDIDWSSCFKIIKEIAQCVRYIHEQRVIHLDLKPENILFDSDMTPVVIDFGLSKVLEQDEDYKLHFGDVVGTMGYISPELFSAGEMSFKSDVYSFGMTIFGTIMAQWRWMFEDEEEMLVDAGGLNRLVNPAIKFDESQLPEVKMCVEVGRLCTQFDPAKRPSMADVVDMLSGKETLPTPNKLERLVTKKMERSVTKKLGRADSRA